MAVTSEHLGAMAQSPHLADSLDRASRYAAEQTHPQVTVEHLLLALLEDPELDSVLADLDRAGLSNQLVALLSRLPQGPHAGDAPTWSEELRRLLSQTAMVATTRGRSAIDGPLVVEVLLEGRDTEVVELLRRYGIQPAPPEDAGSSVGRAARGPRSLASGGPDDSYSESGEGWIDEDEATLNDPEPEAWDEEPAMMDAPWPAAAKRESAVPAPQRVDAPPGAPALGSADLPTEIFDLAPDAETEEMPSPEALQRHTGAAAAPQAEGNRRRVAEIPRSGSLVENVPRTMRVAEPARVEARIAAGDKAPTEGLAGTPHQHALTITRAMSVRLVAPRGGFIIEQASPETQWVDATGHLDGVDYARWCWTVTATERGKRPLQLVVAARTVSADGITAESPLPEQIIDVEVRANMGKTARQAGGWLVATLIGGILGAFSEEALALFAGWMP